MGGYLALLVARALHQAGESARLAGMVLIAPAVDFTEALIWARAPEEARRAIMEKGVWAARPLFRGTLSHHARPDRRRAPALLFGRPSAAMLRPASCRACATRTCPTRHALRSWSLAGDPVTLTLIKDGDHRLSRPQDLRAVRGLQMA